MDFFQKVPDSLIGFRSSTSFIFQAMSMAVQRGKVQRVQGANGESAFEGLDEIFYIVQSHNIF